MPESKVYVAIMAGGVGSRFWPASRNKHPKQFLDILGLGKSLLQLTFERFLKICPAEHIFIVTNAAYHDLVQQQLPQITDNQILLEPSRNNTAPCIAYAAFKIQAFDATANLIVAPSDHIILDTDAFIKTLQQGLDFCATSDALLTLGIRPTRPDTGYGYIHFEPTPARESVHRVKQFTEKPPLAQARTFVERGDYLWNAGIFVWRVQTVLEALQRHAPDIYSILEAGSDLYNTPSEQAFIDAKYPDTPSISIDFAIMEKADNVFTIPSDFGWSDLGTWASLYAESEKDANGNVIQAEQVLIEEANRCLVRAPKGKLLVIKGLEGFIVVDEPDVLLIHPMEREQEIKQLTAQLMQRYEENYL